MWPHSVIALFPLFSGVKVDLFKYIKVRWSIVLRIDFQIDWSIVLNGFMGWPKNTDSRSTDPHYGPGPWTTHGPVHGLPLNRPLYGPPNKIKNKNKDFTYCLSNRSLVSAKFRAFHWSTQDKCDRPGFCLGRKLCHYRSLHLCHFRCCGFAWKIGKPKKFVISLPSPFHLYLKLWSLGRVHKPAGE